MASFQGKEEFEKTQKELLEKGNIMWQGKGQLEQQQVRVESRGQGQGVPPGSRILQRTPLLYLMRWSAVTCSAACQDEFQNQGKGFKPMALTDSWCWVRSSSGTINWPLLGLHVRIGLCVFLLCQVIVKVLPVDCQR